MDKREASFSKDNAIESNEVEQQRGVALRELIEQKDLGLDQATFDMLKLTLEQHGHLSHVEVVFISPEEEPDTGGFFHRVRVDEQTFVPTIFIVSKDQEHMRKLRNTRQSSAQRTADMLGIDFSKLTPNLLRQFIIAHEIGHASDYVKNYETNPDYQGAEAAEEWGMHYSANLSTMPVPGFDPVGLLEETAKFYNLQAFLGAHPNIANTINTGEIKSLQDLLRAQEVAYRSSVYESYADNFAANFLKKNAKELGILELTDRER